MFVIKMRRRISFMATSFFVYIDCNKSLPKDVFLFIRSFIWNWCFVDELYWHNLSIRRLVDTVYLELKLITLVIRRRQKNISKFTKLLLRACTLKEMKQNIGFISHFHKLKTILIGSMDSKYKQNILIICSFQFFIVRLIFYYIKSL